MNKKSNLTTILGKREILKTAGVSKDVVNRSEKIADIPEEKFEAVIAEAKEKPITYADVEKKRLIPHGSK